MKNRKKQRVHVRRILAPFLPAKPGKKPGFPLQVLGFANANPVGFPLQSQCARTSG
jgi:hypothetical protein